MKLTSLKNEDIDTLAEIVASGAINSGEISESEVIDRLTKDARNWRHGRSLSTPHEAPNALPSVCPFDKINSKANMINLLFIAFAGITFAVFFMLAGKLVTKNDLFQIEKPFSSPLMLYIAVIIAPILSELVFRKLLFTLFRKHVGFATAAFFTAYLNALFSSLFFDSISGMFLQFVYAFCAAFFCAYVFEHTKNVWASVVFHFFTNITGVIGIDFLPPDLATVVMSLSGVAAIYTVSALTFRLVIPSKKAR
ncbi:MAG: CPBP family intramembrane metalloprotease [Ruminococcus sp.]|jgi:membrane protease YdiL (CAAX protease family)|nr:CPBP family intramembrane metalloprotease [Ruminococcus sp.]